MKRIYQELASRLTAIENCERKLDAQTSDSLNPGAAEWLCKHADVVDALINLGPSGSGIDSGFNIDYDATRRERLVLKTSFHHMDCVGGYDGWTMHEIIITPSLEFGFDIRVTGRDRKDIKEYLVEVFDHWLNLDVEVTYTDSDGDDTLKLVTKW